MKQHAERPVRNKIGPVLVGALLLGLMSYWQPNAPVAAQNRSGPDIPEQSVAAGKSQAKVAIIIDDIGYLYQPAEDLLQLPANLTFAVLPFTPYGEELAQAAHRRGREVMLHLPMATLHGLVPRDRGLIPKTWPDDRIAAQLDADLQAVPWVAGIDNHMGSAGRHDGRYMNAIMKEAAHKHVYYIDSVTDVSVAEKYAELNQVRFARRDVFIDHYRSMRDNEASIERLIKIALKQGRAIGIGHPRQGTAAAIRAMLPRFRQAGVTIVPVSELLR